MKENRFIRRRVTRIIFLAVSTFLFTFFMGVRTGMSLDEVIIMFFLDLVFLAVFVSFLEEERLSKRLPMEETNDFKQIAFVYVLGMFASYGISYLPEYATASFIIAAAMTLVSNREMALTAGVFLNISMAISLGQDIHVLSASIFLTLFGVMLVLAGQKKQYYLWVQFITFFGTIVIITSCYYSEYLMVKREILLIAAASATVNILSFEILNRVIFSKMQEEQQATPYQRLLEPDYPLVGSIRRFSEVDYSHGVRVSNICGECARLLQLNEDLCRSAGFYYRIGRMEGEPYIEKGVILAENSCFPEKLVQILREYNGELMPISTKESAVVHMVDRVVTKLDLFDKKTFSTNWNQDMVIYQTLNEESATGIYDESGLSMNQFLKIRDFLVKGDHLF